MGSAARLCASLCPTDIHRIIEKTIMPAPPRAALSDAGRQAPPGVPVWHAKQLHGSQHQGSPVDRCVSWPVDAVVWTVGSPANTPEAGSSSMLPLPSSFYRFRC